MKMNDEIPNAPVALLASQGVSITWVKASEATANDETMNTLLQLIEQDFSHFRHELRAKLQYYHQFREELYTVDGVIVYNGRVVVPLCLRETVLRVLQSAHHDVSSMTSRASVI